MDAWRSMRLETRARLQRGQSLVEMTVGIVILTLLVMGILDLGRLYFTYLALQDAAGEGALYLSLNPACPEPSGSCNDPRNARFRALNSGGENVNWLMATFSYTYTPPGGTAITTLPNPLLDGTVVTVNLQYPFPVLTPVVSVITGGNPIMLGVTASNRVVLLSETGS